MGTNRELFLKEATASEYVGRIVEHQLGPVGIPGYLLAILTHVRDLTPVSPTEISRISGVPMTTLRDNIQRLVERKLVRRRANPADGRSYLVVLTPRGRAVTHEAGEALHAAYLALESHLRRPREEYERMLEELNDSLELALADLLEAGAAVEARAG